MNKKIRTIASVMIVLLAIVLIIIFASYNSNYNVNRESSNNMHVSGEPILKDNNEGIIKKETINEVTSGESIISGESKTENDSSGDNSGESIKPSKKPERKDPPKPNSSETTVISSRTETSNQEKQEILNEIDDALKGLLDAVGKVKTVDETKLDASLESEVEP